MAGLRALAFALLVLIPALAGCLSARPQVSLPTIDPRNLVAPEAAVELMEGDLVARITWKGPLQVQGGLLFTIPPEVTRVDAVFHREADADDPYWPLAFYNAETSRIRCQPEISAAWLVRFQEELRCSGLTQVDPLDGEFLVQWRTAASFNRRAGEEVGFAHLHDGEKVVVELSTAPIDGQAALIKLDQLSMPMYEQMPTEVLTITASDGTPLYAELTRPKTDGPVPTIISSNPYNQATRAAGLRPENSTINDWVPRGYAVLSADVRGFGLSGGCIEVWGRNEQRDQYDLVEWAARQPWSNGKVGFYGQSYVGTTPVEAASLAAPHLTTILTIAPVINAYEDWHFGGVPNGENLGSPVSYQSSDTLYWTPANEVLSVNPAAALNKLQPDNLQNAVEQASTGFCDPTLAQRANDPRAVYDDFYRERDFKLKADDVAASVFYTQGFYDENVKSQMIPGWFDKLRVPKKALFGDWVHQHPPRADQELLFHAWFDEWLLGRDTGIMQTPPVEVRTNLDTVRTADDWPPKDVVYTSYGLRMGDGKLAHNASGSGNADLPMHPLANADDWTPGPDLPSLVLSSEALPDRLYVAGQIDVMLKATVHAGGNAHFYAELRDVAPDGESQILSFGMRNAALRHTYEHYQPVTPGETIELGIPLLVTEYVVPPGHKLELELRAADVNDWAGALWGAPQVVSSSVGRVTLDGAASSLRLPVLPNPGDVPAPDSAGPNPLAHV